MMASVSTLHTRTVKIASGRDTISKRPAAAAANTNVAGTFDGSQRAAAVASAVATISAASGGLDRQASFAANLVRCGEGLRWRRPRVVARSPPGCRRPRPRCRPSLAACWALPLPQGRRRPSAPLWPWPGPSQRLPPYPREWLPLQAETKGQRCPVAAEHQSTVERRGGRGLPLFRGSKCRGRCRRPKDRFGPKPGTWTPQPPPQSACSL